jgi:hypothetical protein
MYQQNGFKLGQWVTTLRIRRNSLTPDRITRLEALPGWVWNLSDFQWQEGFAYLQVFTASEGHSSPPKRHKENGYSLGQWVINQRGLRDKLTPERIARLETLPGWVWDVREFQWEEGYASLQRFTALEGHSRPPSAHKENGYNLGQWVSNQRSGRNTLTPERITRLETLSGWVWDISEFQWEEGFSYLQQFTAGTGHGRPSKRHKENGYSLGEWVGKQRASGDQLTAGRITRLEALPGWVWDVSEFQWEEGVSALQRFTASEGHSRPPHAHKENGYNLGIWVTTLRKRRDTLTPDRIARLEALPGWVWDVLEFQWEEGFSSLQRFTTDEGHARPRGDYKEEGFNLGQWVGTQRQSRNTLTPERITRLEASPGWVWDISEFQWEEGFSYLQRFTTSEGHARPLTSHKENEYNLGQWVRNQRSDRNTLTPERIARLEALPGWVWDVLEFQWEEGFSYLQRFTTSEGHSRPPIAHKENGYNLGQWVGNQRSGRNTLTPERIARLEALPGWVWAVRAKGRSA